MAIQQDFKELLELLNAHAVEYVIVGAHALAFHGIPRYTGDIDIYVRPDPENARCITAALDEFGFCSVGLSQTDFIKPGKVIQLGRAPVRVDFVTSLSGLSWEEVFTHKAAGHFADVPVAYLGREQLVMNKRACGRMKDLADLEALGEGTELC